MLRKKFFSASLLFLTLQASAQVQELQNMDLESWQNGDPTHWLLDFGHGAGPQGGTLNWYHSLGEPLSTFEETSNPAGGTGSSARLVSVITESVLKDANVPAIPGHLMRWESYNLRPIRFSYDYIAKPLEGDFGAVYIEFFNADTTLIGKGEVYYLSETHEWQRETQTIDWLSEEQVSYMRITCVSSVLESDIKAGSELWVDNFEIEQESLSTNEPQQVELTIFPNPASDYIQYTSEREINQIVIYDITGKEKDVLINYTDNSINISNLPDGKYIISFATGDKTIRRFFMKRN